MDPDNPVIALCARGMAAESEGRPEEAASLFLEAWQAAADDYEACVAAHYLARHQSAPADVLHWNQEALTRADRVGDDRVQGFYASLHLNLARARADLGEPELAREHYLSAAGRASALPPGPYADWVRAAVADGLHATGSPRPGPDLTALLDALCERRDHRSLALVLPAYLTHLGTPEDEVRLSTALQMLHASRTLPDGEQDLLGRALAAAS